MVVRASESVVVVAAVWVEVEAYSTDVKGAAMAPEVAVVGLVARARAASQ